MMKNGWTPVAIVLSAALAWGLAASVSQGQKDGAVGAGTRLGVVDLVRVFNEFEQTKMLNVEIDKYKARIAEEKQQREEKIEVEKNTLQGFAPESTEYQQRRKEVKKMMIDYRAWLEAEQQGLTDEHRQWIERTYDTVTQCITTLAKSRGIQVVVTREDLDKSVSHTSVLLKQILNRKVLYSDPDLDLTEEVLKSLNDNFTRTGAGKAIKFGS